MAYLFLSQRMNLKCRQLSATSLVSLRPISEICWRRQAVKLYTNYQTGTVCQKEPPVSPGRKHQSMGRKLTLVAMAVAGVVALVCTADLAAGFPFGRYSVWMDVLYLISAGVIAYMGFDTYREQG